MSFRKPCHMPFHELIPSCTLTGHKWITAVTTNTRFFSVCLNLSFRGRQSTVSMVFHAL